MHDERLPQTHERGDVHRTRLEPSGVGVVIAAPGRKLETRAPTEAGRTEEREIAHPEAAGRKRSVQPLVAEGHHRVRPEILDIDPHLPKGLRRVDDRDRAGLARDPARLAHGQHVAGLAGHE